SLRSVPDCGATDRGVRGAGVAVIGSGWGRICGLDRRSVSRVLRPGLGLGSRPRPFAPVCATADIVEPNRDAARRAWSAIWARNVSRPPVSEFEAPGHYRLLT